MLKLSRADIPLDLNPKFIKIKYNKLVPDLGIVFKNTRCCSKLSGGEMVNVLFSFRLILNVFLFDDHGNNKVRMPGEPFSNSIWFTNNALRYSEVFLTDSEMFLTEADCSELMFVCRSLNAVNIVSNLTYKSLCAFPRPQRNNLLSLFIIINKSFHKMQNSYDK